MCSPVELGDYAFEALSYIYLTPSLTLFENSFSSFRSAACSSSENGLNGAPKEERLTPDKAVTIAPLALNSVIQVEYIELEGYQVKECALVEPHFKIM